MQLYAFDSNVGVIHAAHASKQKNYECIECKRTIRLRGGLHRQSHFYHLQPNQACRLNGKSMKHLMLQHHLKFFLPGGEVFLEHQFPAINRIADVVWVPQKIVFEIQCSSISAEELINRNSDYASLGYQVVWVLHECEYNQQRLTAAENALRFWPHYFSDMNSIGEGEIYDQLAFTAKGMRSKRFKRLSVDLSMIRRNLTPDLQLDFPKLILERFTHWPVYFGGDSIDYCMENFNHLRGSEYLNTIFTHEAEWFQDKEDLFSMSLYDFAGVIYKRWMVHPYQAILRVLLERASR